MALEAMEETAVLMLVTEHQCSGRKKKCWITREPLIMLSQEIVRYYTEKNGYDTDAEINYDIYSILIILRTVHHRNELQASLERSGSAVSAATNKRAGLIYSLGSIHENLSRAGVVCSIYKEQ